MTKLDPRMDRNGTFWPACAKPPLTTRSFSGDAFMKWSWLTTCLIKSNDFYSALREVIEISTSKSEYQSLLRKSQRTRERKREKERSREITQRMISSWHVFI